MVGFLVQQFRWTPTEVLAQPLGRLYRTVADELAKIELQRSQLAKAQAERESKSVRRRR